MKKLGKIQTIAFAGLSALALATPIALAQNTGGEQGQQKQEGARGGRHGKGEFGGRRGGRGGGEFGRGGHFGGRLFRGVELTDEQKTRLAELRKGFGERTQSLRQQLRARHEELRQAESGTTFNEAVATQKLTEAAGLQAKLMAEEFRLRQESLAVLTPEQRTQVEQRRQQHEQRRQQRKAQRGQQQQQ